MSDDRVSQNTRALIGAAALGAQLIAVASGAMPAWILIWTIPALAYAAMLPPLDVAWIRQAATVISVASVIGVLLVIARRSIGGELGGDPIGSLEVLVGGLSVLCAAQAPTWSKVREHRLWLGVSTATLATAAAAPQAELVKVPLAAGWGVVIAAAMLLQIDAFHSRGDSRARVVAAGGEVLEPPRPRLAPIASMLLSVGLAGAVIFMVVPHQLGGGGLSTRLAHDAGFTNPNEVTNRGDAGIDTFGSGYLSLDVRGSLPDTPILQVPADSPQLWQGTVYRHYSGQDWQASSGSLRAKVRKGSNVAVPQDPNFLPLPTHPALHSYHAQILSGVVASLIWAPGVPVHLQGNFDGIFEAGFNLRAFGPTPLTNYVVTVAQPTASARRLGSITRATGAGAQWLQLPSELPARVQNLARQITAGDTTVAAKVESIESYLRAHERYTIDAPVPSSGQDAVDQFLFDSHEGFCEQFASAATVLLRSVGVDSRLVSGLAYGDREGDSRVITEADAHAWVQVYYDGVGWVSTDPTLNATLLPPVPSRWQRIRADVVKIVHDVPGGALGVIALVLVVVGAVTWLSRRRRLQRQIEATGLVLLAFLRFTRKHRGAQARAASETPREWIQRVAGDDAELATALGVLEQECYGSQPPADESARAAAATFRR